MRDLRRRWPLAAMSVLLGASLVVAACERPPARPAVETAGPAPPPPPPPDTTAAPVTADTTRWNSAAGPVLLVAGNSPQQAVVIFPGLTDSSLTGETVFDTSIVRGARVDLFTKDGSVGHAALVPANNGTTSEECTSWPLARVVPAERRSQGRPWTVGFFSGRVVPIPLDSVVTRTSADSFKLAAEITRVAAGLPNDTAAAFRGLPFAVRSVRRFQAAPGVTALVADVERKLNVEATPRQERLLIVAERDSTQPNARYRAAYSERVSGPEETIETSDVLAVVRVAGQPEPVMIINRDYGDGTAYAFVAREGPHRWRLRWSSAYTGC